jgi:hypothetical protein
MPPKQVERAVIDYCAEAAKNLANFTNEQWRAFLRIIVRTIIFHGNRVTIQGQIPVNSSGTSFGADVLLEAPLV